MRFESRICFSFFAFFLLTNSYLQVLVLYYAYDNAGTISISSLLPPITPPTNHQRAATTAVASRSPMDQNAHKKGPNDETVVWVLCIPFFSYFEN